jgi:hypothetical protein
MRANAIELYNACPEIHATPSSIEPWGKSKLMVRSQVKDQVLTVGEVMWGDDASYCRDTLGKWWDLLVKRRESGGYVDTKGFWRIICADVLCGAQEGTDVRRTKAEDELAFGAWSTTSQWSPFSWHSDTSCESRISESDQIWSEGARAWRAVLRLWPTALVFDPSFQTQVSDENYLPNSILQSQEYEKSLREVLDFVNYGLVVPDYLSGNKVRPDPRWRHLLERVRERFVEIYGADLDFSEERRTEQSRAIETSIMTATLSRRLIVCHYYIGLGPAATKVGDDVHLLMGGRTPFVLRPKMYKYFSEQFDKRDNERYDTGGTVGHEVIGDCYVHGLMDRDTEGDSSSQLWTLIPLE